MKAKSLKAKDLEEAKKEIENAIDNSFQPGLAIVFMSVSQDIDGIRKLLNEKDIQIFGATTNGEFIDDEIGKGSITIMLLEINANHFKIYTREFPERNYKSKAESIAREAALDFANPGFLIVASHMETDPEEFLVGFKSIIGKNVIVNGGMAGDDFTFKEQYVFTNSISSNNGLIALALDNDKIEIYGHALCGWKSIGTNKTVTKSVGNRVYSIEGLPALDITAKYGGLTDVTENNENLLMEMATMCPLQLQRENAPPVMRPGLVINWEDRSFSCSGKVPEGSIVKFSLPPDFDAIEDVITGCLELREKIPDPDAVIYFTCAGRLVTFGPVMSQEIEGIQEVWKAPMIGMFSNAELGRAKGGDLEMHNLSSNIIVLKEK